MSSIFYNFFFRQFASALFPGKIPVSKVDHELDEKIPFKPEWMKIYLDFTQFWIRVITFFTRRYGKPSYMPIKQFILSIGRLYVYAAEVYTKNLSTTKRPFYIKTPRFLVIHLIDPHLMCIPSLHVMIAVQTYTQFKALAKKIDSEENLKHQIEEMKQGALAITQAVLFVKQHSVNCIPAALYAMTCFSPELFTREEAENFVSLLYSEPPDFPAYKNKKSKTFVQVDKTRVPGRFTVHPAASPLTEISKEDQDKIKNHILMLYNRFVSEREPSRPWYEPLVKFLGEYGKN